MPEARLERTRRAYGEVNSNRKCNHRWTHLVKDAMYLCSECNKIISELEFKLGPIQEVEGY